VLYFYSLIGLTNLEEGQVFLLLIAINNGSNGVSLFGLLTKEIKKEPMPILNVFRILRVKLGGSQKQAKQVISSHDEGHIKVFAKNVDS